MSNSKQCCSKIVVEKDLIIDIIKSKEVVAYVFVRDFINHEDETFPSNYVGEIFLFNQCLLMFMLWVTGRGRTNKVTKFLICISFVPILEWYAFQFIVSNDVINPNISHEFEILREYMLGREIMLQTPKHKFYTYEEQITTTSNYLNDRSAYSKRVFYRSGV